MAEGQVPPSFDDNERLRRAMTRAGFRTHQDDDREEGAPEDPHAAADERNRRQRQEHRLHYDFNSSALGDWMRGMKHHEADTYFSFSPKGGMDPRTQKKHISDKQLKEAIARLILEDGCSTIYCYSGSKIDPQLTARAQQALSEMMRPGHVLHDRLMEYNQEEARLAQQEDRDPNYMRPQVSSSRMDGPEPFLGLVGRLYRPFQVWNENHAAEKADKKVVKSEKFLDKRFH